MSGIAIGDAAMDWAETASAIPGADHSPLYPMVAAWASWGATNAGDFTRGEELLTAAEAAEDALGVRGPDVLRVRGVLAMYQGDAEAARYAEEWVEQARGLDAYELAHALTLLAVTRGFDMPTIEEAVRVARDGGITTALSLGLVSLAMTLPIEESARALALLDEAIDLGIQSGDRMSVAMATANKAGVAARRGEWRAALLTSIDAAEQQLELGDLVSVDGSLVFASAALRELGHLDPAAVLLGRTAARSDDPYWVQWFVEFDAANTAALVDALGEQRFGELTARGAALDIADAIAYMREEADRALGTDVSRSAHEPCNQISPISQTKPMPFAKRTSMIRPAGLPPTRRRPRRRSISWPSRRCGSSWSRPATSGPRTTRRRSR